LINVSRLGFGIIRQLDRQLALAAADGTDPELAALWLLSPLRLAKLYQLRCAANLGTCAESKQAICPCRDDIGINFILGPKMACLPDGIGC
jgi:hypothetical protein